MAINLQFGRVWWGFGREKKQGRRRAGVQLEALQQACLGKENGEEKKRWAHIR